MLWRVAGASLAAFAVAEQREKKMRCLRFGGELWGVVWHRYAICVDTSLMWLHIIINITTLCTHSNARRARSTAKRWDGVLS